MEQKKNKKLTKGTIVGIFAGTIISVFIQQFFFQAPPFEKQMTKAAIEINKALPVMVDEYSRLEKVKACPGNIIRYYYTLVNLEKSDVNLDTVKKYIEPSIINNIRISPEMEIYRKHKTKFDYYYNDKNGVFVLNIPVTPEIYSTE